MPRKSSASLAFSTSTTARLKPPDDLTGPEREVFLALVLACRADHFQPSDAPLLTAYCRAVCLERTASSELAAAGYVTDDGKPSGWLPILQAATRTMSTYSRMLRLNPAGRQTVPSQSSEDKQALPVSYYDRMELENDAN
jgi:phage terminase small subunit